MLVEKTVSKLQESGLTPGLPQGSVSRAQLEELFHAGKIGADTNVLKTGGTGWVRYGAFDS